MIKAWQRMMQALPGTCQVCGGWPAQPVCSTCSARFAHAVARCPGCALRVPEGTARCGACLTRRQPAALQWCVSAVDYAYPWDGLMARFKFRGETGWARPMAHLMLQAQETRELVHACDLMVPVPLTTTRLASRGYNQAWELCRALRRSPLLGAHVPEALPDALLRLGDAPDQHLLPREQRLHNLDRAFVAHPRSGQRLAGARVVLVDDVSTTGATLQAAARALRAAGAQAVGGLVFARTPAP